MDRHDDLRVSRIHHPVTTLGPGRRFGLWVQGCTIGCHGCISRDTWSADAGWSADTFELAERMLAAVDHDGLDGITISGGEPFEQPTALAHLVGRLRRDLPPHVDILVYSGLRWSQLERTQPAALDHIDAVIAEPYLEQRPPTSAWMGSSNQRLVPLTELGRERYAVLPEEGPAMQVAVDDGTIWMIGIPTRGSMESFRDSLARRGVELEEVSWAP